MLNIVVSQSNLRLLVAVLVFALAGCTHAIRGGPRTTMDDAFSEKTASLAANQLNKITIPTARDDFIEMRLMMIDRAYQQYVQQLNQERTKAKLAAQLGDLFLSVGGTLTNSTIAKTNLAGASTLLNGSSAIVDRTLFYEQTISALVAAMDANRARVRLRIARSIGKRMEEYPKREVFSDLLEYESAGTLLGGILYVHAAAKEDKKQVDALIDAEVRDIFPLSATERSIKGCATTSLAAANVGRSLPKLQAAVAQLGLPVTKDQNENAQALAEVLQDQVRRAADHDTYLKIDDAFRKAGLYTSCGE